MSSTRKPFGRAELTQAPRVLLNRGRWPKAEIWRVRVGDDEWVVKDFHPRGLAARLLVGASFVRRELRALQRLAGVPGVVQGAFGIDRYALAYRYVPGRPLATIRGADQPTELFVALERTLRDVHARGIVHLDIRNCRNVIVDERDEPVLLDFEAHVDTRGWPRGARERLERFDLAGVYKHWHRARPATLGPQRLEALERMNKWRKAWVFRGVWYYPRELRKLLRRWRHRVPGDSGPEARR
jgi:RIO-like serine/threonine protein kinase